MDLNENLDQNEEPKDKDKDSGLVCRPNRFRVVKLVSSEPYLRGRWNCKDFVSKESEKDSNILKELTTTQTTVDDRTTAVVRDVVNASVGQNQSSEGVAIDNKIEQAMDLVKSHLMFAVREEVDVLKERIKELESEIQILRAHASNDTLQLLERKEGTGGQPDVQ